MLTVDALTKENHSEQMKTVITGRIRLTTKKAHLSFGFVKENASSSKQMIQDNKCFHCLEERKKQMRFSFSTRKIPNF